MVIPLWTRSKNRLLINSNHKTTTAKTLTLPTSWKVWITSWKRKLNYFMWTPCVQNELASADEKVLFKQFLSNNLDVFGGLPPICWASTPPSSAIDLPSIP